nr:MAG TPA: periplasmic binding protein [Caudoviricetes sp.]
MRAKRVWAMLLAIVVAAIAMVGCSDGATDQPDDGETGGQTVEKVVYDGETFKATYLGITELDSVPGVCYIQMKFENKTDQEITVYPQDSSVNDTMVQYLGGFPATMQGGKNINYSMFFYLEKAGLSDISEVKTLEFKLTADFNETSETITINVGE